MTAEEMRLIKAFVAPQIKLLPRIKKEHYNDEWTTQFDSLVLETKNALIEDLEIYILEPVETVEPKVTRTFKSEDVPKRKEIREAVNAIFQKFKLDNQDVNKSKE